MIDARDFRLSFNPPPPPPPPLSSLPFCFIVVPNAFSLLKHFSSGWPNTSPLVWLLVLPFRPSLLILLESKKLVVSAFLLSKSGARRFWLFCRLLSVADDSVRVWNGFLKDYTLHRFSVKNLKSEMDLPGGNLTGTPIFNWLIRSKAMRCKFFRSTSFSSCKLVFFRCKYLPVDDFQMQLP